MKELKRSNNDKRNIININEGIFQLKGEKITCVYDTESTPRTIWMKGKEVAKYLEYIDTKKAISEHVEKRNKKTYEEILEIYRGQIFAPQKELQKNTIFINLAGFFNLIHRSKKRASVGLRSWLDNEVLVALYTHGSYSIQQKELQLKIIRNITEYTDKMVVYVGYVGIYNNENIFKFGITQQLTKRIKQHRKIFERFEVVYLKESLNREIVERNFKNELEMWNIKRKIKINESNQTELFTVTMRHKLKDITERLTEIIDIKKLPIENKSKLLEKSVNSYQTRDEIKILKLQYKISDNYRIKQELKKSRAEMKSEENKYKYELERMKIELEVEKSKIEMEKQKIELEKQKIALEIQKEEAKVKRKIEIKKVKILKWFKSEYKETYNFNDILKLRDVYDELEKIGYYRQLDIDGDYESFKRQLKKDNMLRKDYKKCYWRENDNKIYKDVLIGWKKNVEVHEKQELKYVQKKDNMFKKEYRKSNWRDKDNKQKEDKKEKWIVDVEEYDIPHIRRRRQLNINYYT